MLSRGFVEDQDGGFNRIAFYKSKKMGIEWSGMSRSLRHKSSLVRMYLSRLLNKGVNST